jgi:hypothetical protein
VQFPGATRPLRNAAVALIMLTLGPIDHVLPHQRTTPADP